VSVPSFQFLALVAVVAGLLAVSPASRWRRGLLVVANVGFFCSFAQGANFAEGAWSLAPFAAFLACGYLAMRALESHKNRLSFFAILAFLIGGFCWLKRYAFFPPNLQFSHVYVAIGLSYAFFRVVGLVVDAYQDVLPARVGIFAYLNYALNFTSFVSGPVELYAPFWRDEIERPAPLDWAIVGTALERIVLGFLKVTVLSPILSAVQERCLDLVPSQLTTAGRVVDVVAIVAIFPIYLYVNFSGYTDVVIGAARFLRFELPENFNEPFFSRGYLEFWTRWHMSLANWFKTYVYSPFLLALMRRFPSRDAEPLLGVAAYFVTFFLVGLWHGQTVMFLILGFLMGLGTSGNKLFQTIMIRAQGRAKYKATCDNALYASLSSGLTFVWLSATLVCFWATADQAVRLARLFGPGPIVAAVLAIWLLAAAGYWLATSAASLVRAFQAARSWTGSAYLRPAIYAALAMIVVSVAVILNAPAPHVVYKAF
jgi:D-alanyl-lipoteichoic acid acyltransferase DltB (MBOAT superfamily)